MQVLSETMGEHPHRRETRMARLPEVSKIEGDEDQNRKHESKTHLTDELSETMSSHPNAFGIEGDKASITEDPFCLQGDSITVPVPSIENLSVWLNASPEATQVGSFLAH
ncbi:hypothetical protein NLI96_g372 [Meripilus lineatus]|uniref:Uncharacterized protein n=1 Tax=Meripilus lineatus TaxID=2056292 RepID=A0AAD5YNZ4_9APHY|nr:hypothetical protein NLI96_g372 [Physisporinus lineatus]